VTVDFSQFGGPAATAAANSSGIWTASYVIVGGTIDSANVNVSIAVTDNAGNVATTADTTNLSVDNQPPSVTDPNISITSSGSGTGGVYKVGDIVTAQWNNTSDGDDNTDSLAAANPVTVDFSQFGGPAATAAANSSGIWTASYAIAAGAIDSANLNVSVTVADNADNVATTADTTDLSMDNQAPMASILAVTPDPRTTAVSQIAIVFSEPVDGFDLSDLELTRSGGGNLLTCSQTLATSDNVTWLLGGLSGITGNPGMYVLSLAAANSAIVDAAWNPLAADASGEWLFNSTVAGRWVFYNNSAWDQNDPLPNADDDNAVATDKQALLPGQTATPANITTYSRGINGIMVDIAGLADPAGVTLANIGDYFTFKAGNDSNPGGWNAAPAPIEVLVRQGAGVVGSDRVTLIWADNAIRKQWLQVKVLSDADGGRAGLAEDDVFYFGNMPGDANGDGVVDAADYIALKRAFGSSHTSPTEPTDFDGSGTVGYGDLLVLMGSFGQRTISAPELPARTTSVAPTTTGGVPDIVAEPEIATAEPEPSVPSADEPAAPAGGILTPAEPVRTDLTKSTEPTTTTASPAKADAVAEPELLPAPVADAAAEPELLPSPVADAVAEPELHPAPVADTPNADILAIAASVLGNRLAAGRQVVPLVAWPANSLPPVNVAVRVGPVPTFPSPLLSPGMADRTVADVLHLAAPWWSGNSARHEAPDESWMTRLATDITGKPRKSRLDPIGLDVLAVSR